MLSAICNEVPDQPVVSPLSGAVFERRLLEKYIAENGTDPITNKELTLDQLIDLKVPAVAKPKPPSATSIPAILKALQDEWDAVMLHSFTLRQQLQTARQELSHALYQHDAATRVIARLNKEVTAAREALATLKPQAGIAPAAPAGPTIAATAEAGGAADVPSEGAGLTEEVVARLQDTATILTQERKRRGRTVPEGLTPAEQIRGFTTLASHPIRVWNVGTSQTLQLIRAHDGPVTGLSLHATGDYLLSASRDHNWAFSDIRTGRVLCKVSDTSASSPLTAAQFHPDGLILGTGTQDATIKIWDLKERSNVANFPGHSGAISSIAFSENGYYLATAAEDSTVRLWDLRKLKNFRTIQLDEGYEVMDLSFDQSGTYLAVAGTDVRVYLCKQWNDLRVFNDHTAMATGVRFGSNASYLASTSMDRTLKIYGP
ncbi:Pre-mRNA-processing factor 19 [Portunus trituberculatus]|uniref:Pre-mRNA-processing factor 19 n=1 Tax=Portunus trituberculatus TaxID=210409 RepID=A0A5B7D4H6_PORTR|nr:Pre-mRNA-processing factor 19 [Portunus trituberculatus]